ncbi:hypothetical protein [Hahella chejuensis]|uniref:hypothetical protein n=1 Tax=Hahella chejuensis TaxID=158327 RepID=UPI0005A26751|nr:hypothetical protein [Hahella chejuensis]
MTQASIRKIVVEGVAYNWCIRGNCLESRASHITVFMAEKSGQVLFIDPYAWGVEVRPKTVRDAIIFGLKNGWNPNEKGRPLYLGFQGDGFMVLPKGVKHTHNL